MQLISNDDKIRRAAKAIQAADALLITAGAGMEWIRGCRSERLKEFDEFAIAQKTWQQQKPPREAPHFQATSG